MKIDLTLENWGRISRTIDFILNQKIIKESPGAAGIRGEPEKPKRKPKKSKEEPQAEQLRMF